MNIRFALQFVMVVAIWGSTWIVIRDQLAHVNPSWSSTYRFFAGAVAMFVWCWWKKLPWKVPWDAVPFLTVFAILQFTLNYNLVYRAELYIPSGIPAVAYALLIVPNAVLGWLFLGQRLTARFLGGSALGIVGILLLFSKELSLPGARAAAITGIALTLLGMFATSIGNIMQATRRAFSLPPMAALGWTLVIATALNIVVAIPLAGAPTWDPRPSFLGGVLFLGVLGSAISFAIYFDMIRSMGPAKAAWGSVLVPIIAMGFSTVLEGYHWTPTAVAGAALALVGLLIALLPERRPLPVIAPDGPGAR